MTLSVLDVLARLLHIFGVVIWMGHNYANVIQNPRFVPAKPADPGAMIGRMKKEHGIFRHASLLVLITGFYMLWHRGLLLDAVTLSGEPAIIGVGVWTGTLMVLNLWFIMWPHQKKVLGFVAASDEERIRCSRITFLSSRTNSILSITTLFFMITGSHGSFMYH